VRWTSLTKDRGLEETKRKNGNERARARERERERERGRKRKGEIGERRIAGTWLCACVQTCACVELNR